ncbi:hypothetical protein FB45DRAFT_764498, partial [Roridomyces roridus]
KSDECKELRGVAQLLKTKGPASSMHVADVSQEQQVTGMIEEVVDRHGSLDVMVANAGITMARKPSTPIAEGTVSNRTIDVNARGTFICYKYAGLQTVKQGGGGRIIVVQLSWCQQFQQCCVQGIATDWPYTASKFAVRWLTQSAALEFGQHGITVNAYAPGVIETPMRTSNFSF